MTDHYDEVEAKNEKRDLQTDEQRADIERLMLTIWGRRIMWRVLGDAGVFRLSYAGDALATAFNEGGRNLGLRLLDDVHKVCPDKYTLMLQENTIR